MEGECHTIMFSLYLFLFLKEISLFFMREKEFVIKDPIIKKITSLKKCSRYIFILKQDSRYIFIWKQT